MRPHAVHDGAACRMGYGASRAFPFPQVPVPVPGLGRAHHHHTHTHTTGHGGASSALASDRLNAQRPAPNGGPLEEEMYRFRSGALNKGPQKTPGRPPYEGAALLLHISRSWGWAGGGLHEVPAPWLYSKPQAGPCAELHGNKGGAADPARFLARGGEPPG
jgi:hypothetical protein